MIFKWSGVRNICSVYLIKAELLIRFNLEVSCQQLFNNETKVTLKEVKSSVKHDSDYLCVSIMAAFDVKIPPFLLMTFQKPAFSAKKGNAIGMEIRNFLAWLWKVLVNNCIHFFFKKRSFCYEFRLFLGSKSIENNHCVVE